MTAHGRNDKWLQTQRLCSIHNRLDHGCIVGNATAAAGQRHALSRLNPCAQLKGFDPFPTGSMRLTLNRIWRDGLTIDNYDWFDLQMEAWQSWAVNDLIFYK